jgi:hypothetical protein
VTNSDNESKRVFWSDFAQKRELCGITFHADDQTFAKILVAMREDETVLAYDSLRERLVHADRTSLSDVDRRASWEYLCRMAKPATEAIIKIVNDAIAEDQ